MTSNAELDLCLVPLRVLVVGAGVAGLSTAVSLGKRGHSVLVLESAKELQSIGAGIGVPPQIRQWYESEGVLQSDNPVWGVTEGFEVRRWDTGDVLARTAAPSTVNLVSIHRGDLQLALYSAAQKLENVEIRLDSRVVDIDVDSPAVYVATGERISGDLIIVADGVNSTLKWKICPSESEMAQPTGDAAYRLILPRSLLEKDDELIALVQQAWVKRWDGPCGHVIAYPVHNRELLNVVLIHPDDDSRAEESWKSMTEKQHVVAAFQGWDLVLRKLIDLAPAKVPNFKILTHSPSPAWINGSAILLGDACHAMPPYASQGVAQAVEDAIAITVVLSVIQSKQQLPVALQAYETSRRGRVVEIQTATSQARQHVYRKDGEAQAARNKDQEEVQEAKRSEDVVKIIRSAWAWDAAEAARTALSDILNQHDCAKVW